MLSGLRGFCGVVTGVRLVRRLCGFGIGFYDYINLGAFLEAHRFAIFAGERVFDANFLVELVGTLDGNLRLFRFTGMNRLDNFLDRSRQSDAWLFRHEGSPSAEHTCAPYVTQSPRVRHMR